jgi:UDP-GlcNAc:undecaprenyl-phosphate/decaprenyl-phosphate GlcNAc-1-phosphate transferase
MDMLSRIALIGSVAFAFSLALTPIMRSIAVSIGRVAASSDERWHRRPTALLGGVAVYAVTFAAIALQGGLAALLSPMFVAASAMFALGLVDDLIVLRPMTKLVGQLIAASFVVFMGVTVGWTHSYLIDELLTIFWFVALTNAFNLLDNMDGLCSGIALIASIAVLLTRVVGGSFGSWPETVYLAGLIGALAGFLVYNWPPAKIFLGDSGSLFIGFSLAGLTLVDGPHRSSLLSTVAVPTLIMLIPIFDTVLVTFARPLSGRAVSRGGIDHSSHRLVAMGFSEATAVKILYALAGASSVAAVLTARYYEGSTTVIALLMLAMVLIGVHLARVRVYQDEDFSVLRKGRYTPILVNFTYRRRVFEVLLDFFLVTLAYYIAYQLRFEDEKFPIYVDLFTQSLPIVLGLKVLSLHAAGVYQGVWKYFSLADIGRLVRGTLLGSGLSVVALVYLQRFERYSRAVFIIDAMALLLLLVAARLSFRLLDEVARRHRPDGQRTLIYGAGDGGALLARELFNNTKHRYRPVGFIDDDVRKQHRRIYRIPVLGGGNDLAKVIEAKQIDVVIISTALDDVRRAKVQAACRDCGVKLFGSSFRLWSIGEDPAEPTKLRSLR